MHACAPVRMCPCSIWWQTIPYFLLGVSEVFTNIGCMELFYTQMSEGMRSLGASVYLLSIAVGTYLASALNVAVAAASPGDLWIADNPLFGHYDWCGHTIHSGLQNALALCAGLKSLCRPESHMHCIGCRTCPQNHAPHPRFFWLNAAILAIGLLFYIVLARRYTEKPLAKRIGTRHIGDANDNNKGA